VAALAFTGRISTKISLSKRAELHALAPARSGGFWSAWRFAYEIQQWDSRGHLERVLERRPAWFHDTSPADVGWVDRPPPPHTIAVREDAAGLLWVFVAVPSKEWRSAWPPIDRGVREIDTGQIAMDKLFATMVEVLDPASERVIARQRFDVYAIDAVGTDALALYSTDATGKGRVEVVARELVRR
jgi:hypothetical protein